MSDSFSASVSDSASDYSVSDESGADYGAVCSGTGCSDTVCSDTVSLVFGSAVESSPSAAAGYSAVSDDSSGSGFAVASSSSFAVLEDDYSVCLVSGSLDRDAGAAADGRAVRIAHAVDPAAFRFLACAWHGAFADLSVFDVGSAFSAVDGFSVFSAFCNRGTFYGSIFSSGVRSCSNNFCYYAFCSSSPTCWRSSGFSGVDDGSAFGHVGFDGSLSGSEVSRLDEVAVEASYYSVGGHPQNRQTRPRKARAFYGSRFPSTLKTGVR